MTNVTLPCSLFVETISLSLRSNRLIGRIPSELGLLTKLVSMKLDRNGLTGTLPTSLGNLLSLTVLNVDNNHLMGTSLPAPLNTKTLNTDDVVAGVESFPLKQSPSASPTPISRNTGRLVGPGRSSSIYTVAGGTACAGTCVTVTTVCNPVHVLSHTFDPTNQNEPSYSLLPTNKRTIL